ncbi:MAG: anaerobic ribonucleoside-triphosphate reductase, partial [bacterium]
MTVELKPRQALPVIEDDATDLAVFVRTSTDDIVAWDKEKIIRALIKETGLAQEVALIIALEVEKQLRVMAVKTITAPLVRELVDVKLLEYGLEDARRRHTRLGVPVYDVRKIIFSKNKENANAPHS